MSFAYQVMYRLGFTPWERRDPPAPLFDLVEGPRALPAGDMLDIGCGTGRYAIYCALHGWTVTGVDAVGRALQAARRNADQAGANVRFLRGDIASPGTASELGAGYSLLLDVGCLHGLPDEALERSTATITNAAKPGATFLMLAFAPRRGPGPRGIDPARIPVLFPQWDLTSSRPASEITLSGPVRNARASWYQLTRQ